MGCAMPLVESPEIATAAGYRWQLLAEADPQLPARVLGHFTVCNVLPAYFCLHRLTSDSVQVEMRTEHGDDALAHRMALRLRAIPTVIEVRLWAPDGRSLVP